MSAEPTIFGRYQLLERIAAGGMAEVFRAKLVAAAGTEKVLCIKRILPTHSSNHEFISLFVKEARISLSLTHGNITQVFDFGEIEGVYYLAMEYIFGQDLSSALRRVQEVDALIDLPAALYTAAEVCKGLQYAHGFADASGRRIPVVHRDVTPHNILISYTGEVKLTDFGIALAATKVSTDREVVRGKACYLSPEQADGSPGTMRSDIFSLGAVLYEMLSGIRPFEGDSERETLERVRTLELAPPSAHNPQVDSELDRVVMRALARNPDDRYERAADLQVALTQLLHKRWPDYTGQRLADTLKELFAWEIASTESGESSDKLRDRLLFQLSRAGVEVDAKNATTDELLELGTVAIQGAIPPEEGSRRWVFGLMVGFVLAATAVLALFFWPGGKGGVSAARTDSGPRVDPFAGVRGKIDHLTPPSLRKDPRVPEAPASRPHQRTPRTPRQLVRVNLNSWPWSVVYINGKQIPGSTPLFNVGVPAGRNRIRFVNPELGMSKEVDVTLEPGGDRTIAVELQQ